MRSRLVLARSISGMIRDGGTFRGSETPLIEGVDVPDDALE